MVNFCAVCGCYAQTDKNNKFSSSVSGKGHLEDS